MPSPKPLIARPSGKLAGTARLPGGRSLSLHAMILGALAVGRTSIKGLAEGAEIRRLAAALTALGATVTRHDDGLWSVDGVGVGGLLEPAEVLDLGDSEAAAHLLLGLVATHPLTAIFAGDASLGQRPLARVIAPLERMGAQFIGRRGGLLPLAAIGAVVPMPLDHHLPTACALVKSAILLAGLNTPGLTSVTEPRPTRDDTERLLRRFGARVEVEQQSDGGRRIRLEGQPELAPTALDLPADPAAAAIPLVAALTVEGSDVTLLDVGLDPSHNGLVAILKEMGAAVEILNLRQAGDEPIGDLRVRTSRLRGIAVPTGRMSGMVDDYPILAIAAACAAGPTVLPGLVENDRLTGFAQGLAACGVKLAVDGDTMTIYGAGGPVLGGARIPAGLDAGGAMALLVLGLGAKAPVEIADGAAIETDFPDFAGLMQGLGADISAGTI